MVAIAGSPSSLPRAAQPAWIRQHGVSMVGDERESGPPKPHGDPLEKAVAAPNADATRRTDAAPAARSDAAPAERRGAGRSGRRKADAVVREAAAVVRDDVTAVVGAEGAALLRGDAAALERLLFGRHHDPHSVLGAHQAPGGVVVRVMHHAADKAEVVLAGGETHEMRSLGGGLFAVLIEEAELPLRYRVRLRFSDGTVWERDDPYRFLPAIGEMDLHLFNEGTHRRLWEKLGAHPMTVDGVAGVGFAVWAPTAQRVSLL